MVKVRGKEERNGFAVQECLVFLRILSKLTLGIVFPTWKCGSFGNLRLRQMKEGNLSWCLEKEQCLRATTITWVLSPKPLGLIEHSSIDFKGNANAV